MSPLSNIAFRHPPAHTFLRDERGLSTVEYVVILVLIAIAAIGTWRQFGGTIMSKINNSNTAIRDMEGIASGNGQSPGNAQPLGGQTPGQSNPGPAANPPTGNVSNTSSPSNVSNTPSGQAKGQVVD